MEPPVSDQTEPPLSLTNVPPASVHIRLNHRLLQTISHGGVRICLDKQTLNKLNI